MRVALGDVTPTVSMLLPSLGPALPGTPSYSGGLTGFKRLGRFGLGQACTQWVSASGNACASDPSTGVMEDVVTGVPCTCSAPACLPQGSYGPLQPGQVYCATGTTTPPATTLPTCTVAAPGVPCVAPTVAPTTTTGISTTTIIAGVAVIAVIFAMMARR